MQTERRRQHFFPRFPPGEDQPGSGMGNFSHPILSRVARNNSREIATSAIWHPQSVGICRTKPEFARDACHRLNDFERAPELIHPLSIRRSRRIGPIDGEM